MRNNNNLIRKPKLPLGWVRRMIEGVHTQAEWQEMIRGLPDQAQVQFLLASQPKEIKAESGGLIVRIVLDGIENKRVIRGKLMGDKALPEHEAE